MSQAGFGGLAREAKVHVDVHIYENKTKSPLNERFHFCKSIETGPPGDTCTSMFTAGLLTIAKRRGQPKGPWMDEGINKTGPTHTVGYYSALEGKGILRPTTWMDLGDIC